MSHDRPRASLMAAMVAGAAALLSAGASPVSDGERHMRELFNSGGPGWNGYPNGSRRGSKAAAQKRAARRLRNIRARASKR